MHIRWPSVLIAWFLLFVCGCQKGSCPGSTATGEYCISDVLNLKLPFESGHAWTLTCGYGCWYHTSANNSYYAVDFDINGIQTENSTDIYVLAPADGTITEAGWSGGYGYRVKIDHGNGYVSLVAHLRYAPTVSGFVHQGEILGVMGGTGGDYNDHIHYQLYINGSGNAEPPTPISGYDELWQGRIVYSDNEIYDPSNDCSTVYYPAMLMDVDKDGDEYDISAYYQELTNHDLTKWGPVRSNTGNVSNTEGYFSGRLHSKSIADVVEWTVSSAPNTYIYAYRANGQGGLEEQEQWLKGQDFRAKHVFIADYDGDGYDDIILAKKKTNHGDDLFWYVCDNNGSPLGTLDIESACHFWSNNSQNDGHYGNYGDVFFPADLNGSGNVKLIRGYEDNDCSDSKLKWRRMTQNGGVYVIMDEDDQSEPKCWGYADSQFWADDIDNGGSGDEEVIQVRTGQEPVLVYVGQWNDSNKTLETRCWVDQNKGLGGSEGYYTTWWVDGDNHKDMIQWTTSGKVYWYKNQASYFDHKDNREQIADIGRAENYDYLLFDDFGEIGITECPSEAQSVDDDDASDDDDDLSDDDTDNGDDDTTPTGDDDVSDDDTTPGDDDDLSDDDTDSDDDDTTPTGDCSASVTVSASNWWFGDHGHYSSGSSTEYITCGNWLFLAINGTTSNLTWTDGTMHWENGGASCSTDPSWDVCGYIEPSGQPNGDDDDTTGDDDDVSDDDDSTPADDDDDTSGGQCLASVTVSASDWWFHDTHNHASGSDSAYLNCGDWAFLAIIGSTSDLTSHSGNVNWENGGASCSTDPSWPVCGWITTP